jgi:hypothetical protein
MGGAGWRPVPRWRASVRKDLRNDEERSRNVSLISETRQGAVHLLTRHSPAGFLPRGCHGLKKLMTEEKWISNKPELTSAPKGDRSARRPQSRLICRCAPSAGLRVKINLARALRVTSEVNAARCIRTTMIGGRLAAPASAGALLFSEKILEPRQLDDVFRRQNRADKISLRHRVNFIQMTPRFWLQHKFPDALVESAFDDHVAARAE